VRRTPLLALPVAALAVGAAALAPSASGATTSGPTFGVPRIVDPIHVYGEPNLEVNPKTHAVHATGPQGTGTQRSIWNVSVDNGDSYRIVQNLPQNVDQAAYPSVPSKSALGPGGGDTEIKIASNGQAFFNDLAALASFTAVTTKDDGSTTSMANPLAIGSPGGDRQWMALFDPKPSDKTISAYKGKVPLNYMEYQTQVEGDDTVDLSTDGVDYSVVAGKYANDGVHSPNHGVPLVDQHTGKFLGLVQGKSSNSLSLVVGVPDAAGLLTFHYNELASDLVGDPQTLFPVLAQDGARNLYAVWVDHKTYQVWYSWAPPGADNEWKVWSAPRVVNTAPSNVNVFPWVAAGPAPGIIDVAWYGTNKTLKELGSSGPSAKIGQTWELWFAQIDKADSSSPHVVQVKAAPHPMHYNDICLLGTACITGQGNRNQADFFKMIVDPFDGRARIIYTDSSNRLSQAGGFSEDVGDTAADHQGAALDTVATQNTGLSALTGKPLTPYESTAPVSSWTDPAGDALFKPLGGSKVPGADILSVAMKLEGGNVVVDLRLSGALGTAAATAATPTAQAVVRWQMGDRLYFVAAEATPQGPLEYYGGATDSVDLCSVSGCKPNYLTYNAFPYRGVSQGTGSADGGKIQIKVPVAALGNPTASSLLEEAMAFVTASPQSGVVPQNNGTDFTDQAPMQLEGTRTVNVKLGANAAAPPVVVQPPGSGGGGGGGNPSSTPPSSGGNLAATGLSTGLPAAALLLVIGALFLARRRRLTP
jgi:hypothetical protein